LPKREGKSSEGAVLIILAGISYMTTDLTHEGLAYISERLQKGRGKKWN